MLTDRDARSHGLGVVIVDAAQNDKLLNDLVRRMRLKKVPGQGRRPVHLALYQGYNLPLPLLSHIVRDDHLTETEKISSARTLSRLGCLVSDPHRWTALHHALLMIDPLSPELAQLLIDAGCDPNAETNSGNRPLFLAISDQHPLTCDLAKTLFQAGADPNIKNRHGVPPLHMLIAVSGEQERPLDVSLLDLFLSSGADPSVRCDGSPGTDALAHAAFTWTEVSPEGVDRLLNAGCADKLPHDRFTDETRIRFDKMLQDHAAWKKARSGIDEEGARNPSGEVDWTR